MSDACLNSFADSMRSNLIEGSCVNNGGEYAFEYVYDTDIFV